LGHKIEGREGDFWGARAEFNKAPTNYGENAGREKQGNGGEAEIRNLSGKRGGNGIAFFPNLIPGRWKKGGES